jgi:alpha-mannosidase
VRRAAELNTPLIAYRPQVAGEPRHSQEPTAFARCDAAHVMLDTIKTAEDGDGVIVRVYEAHNQRGSVTLTFARPIRDAQACNLLEETEEPRTKSQEPTAKNQESAKGEDTTFEGNTLRFMIRPFEIRSFRVRFGS